MAVRGVEMKSRADVKPDWKQDGFSDNLDDKEVANPLSK
jgi:hypothetical protein